MNRCVRSVSFCRDGPLCQVLGVAARVRAGARRPTARGHCHCCRSDFDVWSRCGTFGSATSALCGSPRSRVLIAFGTEQAYECTSNSLGRRRNRLNLPPSTRIGCSPSSFTYSQR